MTAHGKASRSTRRLSRAQATAPSSPPDRLRWARLVIAVALAAGVLLASRLFLATRVFPRAPVLDGWPLLQAPLDVIALAALLAALGGVAFAPRPRWWAAAATACALILAVEDQSRCQPWFYQYVAMLAALAVARDPGDTLAAWRVVLAGLYLWSGIQKINVTFMTRLFPWLVQPVAGVLPAGLQQILFAGWVVVPSMEIAVAVGLLVPRLRNAAVNAVIWPWNAAMAVLAAVLFWNARDASVLDTLVPRRIGAHAVMLALFVALPALSLAGRWDAYLSGELYSGNLKVGALSITDRVAARLPDAARRHVMSNRTGANALDLYEWSMGELSVPSYPEDRVFRAVARDVCRLADNPGDVVLVVFGRPGVLTGQREITRNDCAALR
jgi:hypothetical protein